MLTITLQRELKSGKPVKATCKYRLHEKLDGLAHKELADAGYRCVLVEASDDEREWIGRNYTNIPRCNSSTIDVEKWRSDFAVFIYDHLPRFFDKYFGSDHRTLDSR